MKIDSNEMHELLLASELVPTGCRQVADAISYEDADAVSTVAPSSAEQSPEITCMESDLVAWPSLPTPADGWNMCDDESDMNDSWEDLPEPALSLEEDVEAMLEDAKVYTPSSESAASWWLIPGFGTTDNLQAAAKNVDVPSKSTFAELLRDQKGHATLACGVPPRPMHSQVIQHTCGGGAAANKMVDDIDQVEAEVPTRWHGWKNEHKASWNTKQQRKVTTRKLQRQLQSSQARSSLEEEVEAYD